MQKVESQADIQQRLLRMSYLTLASVGLSIVLGLAIHFFQVERGAAEIAKLRAEVVDIKHEMADRKDLQAVRKSLGEVDAEVRKLSDNLQKRR